MLIESKLLFELQVSQIISKKSSKIYFKCTHSIIAPIPKMDESFKYLLEIIQTSTCNLNIK